MGIHDNLSFYRTIHETLPLRKIQSTWSLSMNFCSYFKSGTGILGWQRHASDIVSTIICHYVFSIEDTSFLM